MKRFEVRQLAREIHPGVHISDISDVTFSADGSAAFVEAIVEVRVDQDVREPEEKGE